MRIAVTCGGTGGHIFPGVATASAFKSLGHEITLVLSGRAVESQTLADWQDPILQIQAPRLSLKRPLSFIALWGAYRKAVQAFQTSRPDALLAMGSYTSLPSVWAAHHLKIPVILHEANAIPGKAVKFLSRFASHVALTFQDAAQFLPKGVPTTLTGLPIRANLIEAATQGRSAGRTVSQDARFTVLVMGGSQGAQAINHCLLELFQLLEKNPAQSQRFHFIHLAGEKNKDALQAAYRTLSNVSVELIGFSNQMASLYTRADFCISRAGAASCFELCQFQIPSLLIPLPKLANDHQTANARAMQALGACEWIAQDQLSASAVLEILVLYADHPEKRLARQQALAAKASPHAAQQLAQLVLNSIPRH